MADKTDKDYIIRLAAEVGAKTALSAFEKELRKTQNERTDRRLRNTKLLLRNFRMFKAHAENAIFDASQIDEDAYDIIDLMSDRWNDSEMFVTSIKESVARTVTIVAHIETMLQLYEVFCERSGNPEEGRRNRVIRGMYVDEPAKTIKDLAGEFFVTTRTIYNDIDIACERIAALIFGIDGIRRQ